MQQIFSDTILQPTGSIFVFQFKLSDTAFSIEFINLNKTNSGSLQVKNQIEKPLDFL
jgi:hypothetical protein